MLGQLVGMTLLFGSLAYLYVRFRPPTGDEQPISEKSLANLLRAEGRRGDRDYVG